MQRDIDTVAANLLTAAELTRFNKEFKDYKRLAGEWAFVSQTTWLKAKDMSPREWWDEYFEDIAPTLRKVAMHILGLSVSAGSCERNWSTFDFIHSKKRARLTAKNATMFVYVFCNQRLLDKHRCGQVSEEYQQWSSDETDNE